MLETLANEGILLEPAAIEFVLNQEDPVSYARSTVKAMEQMPLVVTVDDLMQGSERGAPDMVSSPPAPSKVSDESEPEVKVIRDITGESTCEGGIKDFARYFSDRFQTLKRMLTRRRELAGSISIARASQLDRKVKLIGMVNDVWPTKNGHKMLEIEDEEDKTLALILRDSELINEGVVQDEVLGIVGKPSRSGDMVIIEEIIRPNIPPNKALQPSDATSSVAFLSDIHVGSFTFLDKQWNRMTDWLKSNWEEESIEYIVIPGDVVDGIGIFPNQEEELEIDDIFAQYEALAELLKDIPDGIQMIMQPGNHDAVRPAEPQPTFSDKITSLFDSQIMFVGNPCYLEIEGRLILSYHGRSMDDYIGNIQHLSYDSPIEAMKEMLIRRHMAPIYGEKTPLAPEKKDFLIIDRVPDIFVTGHVHGAGISDYRGVRLINASCWQSQTAYQRMHNFNPDPGKMPVVHLGTGRCVMRDFN